MGCPWLWARRKASVYSLLNVAAFVQEEKRLREETAKSHRVLARQKTKLAKLIRKVGAHILTHNKPNYLQRF